MPELAVGPIHAIHPQVLSLVDGDGDRSSWLVTVVAVFIIPDLACRTCQNTHKQSGPLWTQDQGLIASSIYLDFDRIEMNLTFP